MRSHKVSAYGATGPAGPPGAANRIIKFTSATTGGNSVLFDDGANVGLGTTNPAFPLHVISAATRSLQVENSNGANTALDVHPESPCDFGMNI